MTKIFISYRRKDDPYAARGVNDALCKRFGKRNVYFDLEAIQAGLDFRKQIDDMVAKCDVMLVVIGDRWLKADESDRSRLENVNDLVGLEVSSALKRDIPVIPVLVGNAAIPSKDKIPDSIKSLVYRQAVEVRATANFNAQIENLVKNIEAVAPDRRSGLRTGALGIAVVAFIVAIGWLVRNPIMNLFLDGKNGVTQNQVEIMELAEPGLYLREPGNAGQRLKKDMIKTVSQSPTNPLRVNGPWDFEKHLGERIACLMRDVPTSRALEWGDVGKCPADE